MRSKTDKGQGTTLDKKKLSQNNYFSVCNTLADQLILIDEVENFVVENEKKNYWSQKTYLFTLFSFVFLLEDSMVLCC